jgi:glycosyltransferase involved in cell wall biosynthesis
MAGLRVAIYHNLPAGGAKRTLHDMVRRLSRRHRLDCYSLSSSCHDFCDLRPYVHSNFVYPFEATPLLDSPLGRVNALLRSWDIVRLAGLARRVAADIDAGGYDVVFVHPSQITQAPPLLRFLRLPSVYFCQEPLRRLGEPSRCHHRRDPRSWRTMLDRVDPARALYHRLLQSTDRAGVRAATCIVVNSAFSADNVKSVYGLDPKVCYHGVDTALFEPRRAERNGTVLSVGSLTPAKGHEFVIRGLATIPVQTRPRLVIVSNRENAAEEDHLDRLAQELGVSTAIRFHVSDEELAGLYRRVKATVYAPYLEPFGLVPLESMACGTPVVGVREGGIAETILDGETGFLVDRDPISLGRAVETICTEPDLAARLGARGREYVESEWTWDHRLKQLEGHLLDTARVKETRRA